MTEAGNSGPTTLPALSEQLADITLDLELTSVCDAVCGFCPREFMPDKRSFMSMDLVERIADDIRNRPGFPITLCGIGESMLHPQLDEIVKTLAGVGAQVEMTTNGGRMDTERFEQLTELGMGAFHFSLNAVTPETHEAVMKLRNYERIAANLREILALKHRSYPHSQVHISFVVCDLNEHEVDEFVEFWRPHRPNAIWLHPLNNRNRLLSPEVKPSADMLAVKQRYEHDSQVLVDVFGEVPTINDVCKIARAMMFVSVEGEMRLCALDYRRETSFGNLRNMRLHEMHFDKIQRYERGEMNSYCGGCDFCAEAIRSKPSAASV